MPVPPITTEQAIAVDRTLAVYAEYLRRLSRRLNVNGVTHPHQLAVWAQQAHFHVDGLRHHFNEWATGKDQRPMVTGYRNGIP
jgi:AraC-like DNA-binding protein